MKVKIDVTHLLESVPSEVLMDEIRNRYKYGVLITKDHHFSLWGNHGISSSHAHHADKPVKFKKSTGRKKWRLTPARLAASRANVKKAQAAVRRKYSE